VWLPSFLSNKALADLGRLVVLDYILQGERFDNYAAHLSFVDRVQAKALAATSSTSCASSCGRSWKWPTASAPSRAMR
jgi:hypothetical protein